MKYYYTIWVLSNYYHHHITWLYEYCNDYIILYISPISISLSVRILILCHCNWFFFSFCLVLLANDVNVLFNFICRYSLVYFWIQNMLRLITVTLYYHLYMLLLSHSRYSLYPHAAMSNLCNNYTFVTCYTK